MISTGIIRRIDELGRIAIPREIRRTLKIKDGDPLEIYRDKDKLILAKYAPEDDIACAVSTLQEWLKNAELSASMTPIEHMTFTMLLDKVAGAKTDE